jgi:nucleoside-diphosphate kinase
MNRTFAIIKPDAWMNRKVGSILKHAEDAGLHPDQLWIGQPTEKDWARFYEEHAGKPFFGQLVHFMAAGPSVLAILEAKVPPHMERSDSGEFYAPSMVKKIDGDGPDALQTWRELMGATDPTKARPGTLRALYGTMGAMNAVHGSDSKESYQREVAWAMEVSRGGIHRQSW